MSNIAPPGGEFPPENPPRAPYAYPAPSQPVAPWPQAPPGYQPYSVGGPVATAPKSGTLLAGGIVAVVLSAFTIFAGLAIALIGGAIGSLADDIGGLIVLFGLGVLAFGGFGLASGIGAIRRRQWGRICSIVFGSINGAFALFALISEPDGGGIVYLAMSVAIVVLCAIGSASAA